MPLNTQKVRALLHTVLTEITPTDEDTTLIAVNAFLKDAAAEARRLRIKAQPVLGGSFAKHTWLKGDYDVDIFFSFDLTYKKENLSLLLEKILTKFKPLRIHGSRDYFQIRTSINFEVIPVLDIKKAADAQNVTDFSLWHVTWANKKGKKLKDDIRLTKKFCKAQRVYGAESYIRGFSGHVLDILVIHYGGFIPLLKAAAKWTSKVVIDTENHYHGKALQYINTSKTTSPLVVVDPVQPGRNASAAISDEQFEKFIRAAHAFLKKPSPDAFVIKHIDDATLTKKGTLIKVTLTPLDGIENVIGVKLFKAGEFLKKSLEEFGIVVAAWEWDKQHPATWWFVLRKKQLSLDMIVQGPPLRLKEHCARFKHAHKKTFVKKNKLFATVQRPLTTPDAVIRAATADNYLKDKIKKLIII